MRDRTLLYAATFLRAVATGAVAILLGFQLPLLDLAPAEMGLIVGAGQWGNVVAALLATLAGDRIGRRRFLALLGLMGGAGAATFATASHPLVLAGAAFLGMLNAVGRDRGAALVLEQAMLPSTADAASRTRVFAWYNVLGDVGHAVGAALAVLPRPLRELRGMSELASLRATILVCAVLALATFPLSVGLTRAVEAGETGGHAARLSPASRRILAKISALFALDALGGGFLSVTWLTYFFVERFHADERTIGALFVGARIANALSHLGAAWLSSRIGLVKTMVLTHVPSSFLMLTVLVAPSLPVAAVLFLLREGLSQMDVPTRQSYVMAVVRPGERLTASGVTHLVRLGSWAVAPMAAGFLLSALPLASPFAIGASLKLLYDGLLFLACRNVRPPEETAGIAEEPASGTASP
ncbi:MFS transporter [bacterium]|nr:MFS transporter [bacterium]